MIDYKYVEDIVVNAGKVMIKPVDKSNIYKKGNADFVTDRDIEVQKYIYTHLYETYPYIGFVGEEKAGCSDCETDNRWILDPIDGTTNYVFGYNWSAISLALQSKKEVIFGIVYNPYTNELFKAAKGKGTYLNNNRIFLSDTPKSMAEALVAVGTSPYYKDMASDIFSKIKTIFEKSLDIRRTGSAALDLAYVACGRNSAYVEYNLKPWDFAAGALIVEEAGGIVRSIDGKGLDFDNNTNIIACCNDDIYCELSKIL